MNRMPDLITSSEHRQAAREAHAADTAQLAHVLTRAFQYDPVHRWMLPTDSEWARASLPFWTQLLRRWLRYGTVLTTDGLEGTALWSPPNAAREGVVENCIFSVRMLSILKHRALRGLRLQQLLEARHPRAPHWYLSVLGTAPEHRRKGVSAAVMEPVLRRCDAEGWIAYVESSNRANIPLYQSRGFQVTGEVVVRDGPTVWPMVREPRPARAV